MFEITLNFDYRIQGPNSNEEYEAFDATCSYYNSIESHIKSYNAMELVEHLTDQWVVLSAEWDSDAFSMHLFVDTVLTKDEMIKDLESCSLADAEYEASEDNGWILFTRNPGKTYEYCLLDYRQGPIEIKEIREPMSVKARIS
jgi:hypothetical protein